jgi:hypothetical protein
MLDCLLENICCGNGNGIAVSTTNMIISRQVWSLGIWKLVFTVVEENRLELFFSQKKSIAALTPVARGESFGLQTVQAD